MSHASRIPSLVLAAAALAFAAAAAAQAPPAQGTAPPSAPAKPAPAQPSVAPKAAPAGVRAEPVPPQVDVAFKAFDTDHNGALTLAEFRAGWTRLRSGGAQHAQGGLKQQFDHIDANHNGGIDRTEYPNLMLVKRAGAAAPPFSEFDRDRSQKLEYGEYAGLVRRLATARGGAAAPGK